jgi:preprotein translocase subunit SecA
MIGDILKKIFGDKSAKDKKLYWPYVEQATAALESVKALSDNELRAKTNEFKKIISDEKFRNQLAIYREAYIGDFCSAYGSDSARITADFIRRQIA